MKIITAYNKVNLCMIFFFLPLFSVEFSLAEVCKKYTAKHKSVQVYREPKEDAARVKVLKRGDEVCYIGEQGEFAIIELENELKKKDLLSPDDVGYVKLSHLWPPMSKGKKQKEHVKDFFKFWQDGGVADDPFAPFRSLWGGSGPEVECLAGKICERVREKIETGLKEK